MSGPLSLLDFQDRTARAVLQRLDATRALYDALPPDADPELARRIAQHSGTVMLCAPTGAGKTLLAAEILARFETGTPTLWFWFAPFAGLIEQARAVLCRQAPALRLLDLASDRRIDAVAAGGLFVTTWQSVATANQSGRKARSRGDDGAALDDLLVLARAQGMRIGCVVDEAHHGFQKAREARHFFSEVLRPDYAIMMTATPRDADALTFERDTGYRVGDPDEWITVARRDGVDAGLLKRGIKLVRFVAADGDLAGLVDYERLALAECTQMHRHLQRQLQAADIALTPLMLVQVPNGDKEMKDVARTLVQDLGFAESAVRIHTAKEPDPDLIALANDPGVEVLIFKMAVALGFDAPRAFTLAALRGARDADFGVQVIGRLMRVHPLLRHRPLAPELSHGYVFLANAEAQEGLLAAGEEIARLQTQAPELGAQTVISVVGRQHTVQVLRSGESASLLVGTAPPSNEEASPVLRALADDVQQATATLNLFAGNEDVSRPPADTRPSALTGLLARDAARKYVHRLREDVPSALIGEALPAVDGDLEQRVVDHIDLSPQRLVAMHQTLTQMLRRERDVFASVAEERESYVAAQLEAAQVSNKVQRQLDLFDVDPRRLMALLEARFLRKLADAGMPAPADDEALDRALDFVLLHNRDLLREAVRRARMPNVQHRRVELAPALSFDEARERSRRNVYGVLPGFDSEDEAEFARLLDRCEDVLWWHRNPSSGPEAQRLQLYRWNDGSAFHPDFVVAYRGRPSPDHIALVEVKGKRGWGDTIDVKKAEGPAHQDYGRCFFVGREKGGKFQRLLPLNGRLEPHSAFDFAQLNWVER